MNTQVPINKKESLDRLLRMMAIPGKSKEETLIAGFIEGELLKAGAARSQVFYDNAHKKAKQGPVGNLVLKLKGTFKAPRKLMMAHMDTVPLCVGSRPVVKGGNIVSGNKETALGADDRGGSAMLLTVALEILKKKLPHPPVTFVWAVQEEIGMIGARYGDIKRWGSPKLGFNWDGGSCCEIRKGATGSYRVDIVIHGKASHAGSAPQNGINAGSIAALAIADLEVNGWLGKVQKGKGHSSSNIGIFKGGDATNVVLDRLELAAEARSHDEKVLKRILAAFKAAFEKAARKIKNAKGEKGSVEFSAYKEYEAYCLNENEPCLQELIRAMKKSGAVPNRAKARDLLVICNAGLDANWTNSNGIPTATMGCGQRNPHTVNESLVIKEFHKACEVALALLGA